MHETKISAYVHTSPIPLPRGQQDKQANPLVQTSTKKVFR